MALEETAAKGLPLAGPASCCCPLTAAAIARSPTPAIDSFGQGTRWQHELEVSLGSGAGGGNRMVEAAVNGQPREPAERGCSSASVSCCCLLCIKQPSIFSQIILGKSIILYNEKYGTSLHTPSVKVWNITFEK